MPVRITVRGPMDENMEDVEAYLMNIVEDEDVKRDLEAHLKSLDPVAFSDVSISYEANDLPPITVPTYVSTFLGSTDYLLTRSITSKT